MFNVALRPQRPYGLLGMGIPGRPPRLSHSSWALIWSHSQKQATRFTIASEPHTPKYTVRSNAIFVVVVVVFLGRVRGLFDFWHFMHVQKCCLKDKQATTKKLFLFSFAMFEGCLIYAISCMLRTVFSWFRNTVCDIRLLSYVFC